MIRATGVRAIVTDIEGTTGSIAFVHEVLFPYSRARLASFVAEHPDAVGPVLEEARRLAGEMDEAALVEALIRWIDEDRKAGPLKTLQGMIWRSGYESGEIVGHVYDDAVRGLRRWREAGLRLAVYSSGSVEAQKLLFGHSRAGDLTGLFDAWFDTAVGAKADSASYLRIAEALHEPPARVLFLSDAPAEIAAARAAGMQAVRLVREGQAAAGEAASFDEIDAAA